MKKSIDNPFIIHKDVIRAIDQAVWLNFKMRISEGTPFSVIESKQGQYAIVSESILKFLGDTIIHTLHKDYLSMGIEHSQYITSDPNRLKHWTEIYDAFANMDTEVLLFILEMKIPFESFIRLELVLRQKDQNNNTCSTEHAQSIWLK